MAKSDNVLSEDGQHVSVEFPGQALQDQAKVKADLEHRADPNRHSISSPEVDKALEEVRERREENERRAHLHNRTQFDREVAGTTNSGDGKMIEIHVFDQKMYLNTHGNIVLDREGVIALRAACESAFQALS